MSTMLTVKLKKRLTLLRKVYLDQFFTDKTADIDHFRHKLLKVTKITLPGFLELCSICPAGGRGGEPSGPTLGFIHTCLCRPFLGLKWHR